MKYKVNALEKTQLFMLHFAGGNCYSYDFLRPYLPADLDWQCLELPGRGKRFHEKLLFDKAACISDFRAQLMQKRNGKPYILFGHSMGASLGLYVCKAMEALGDPPQMLIVAGNAGPKLASDTEESETFHSPRYLLEDEDLKEALRELGGVPEEVLSTPELFDFFAPIIRADFEVVEKENDLNKKIRLNTPILAIMGTEEKGKEDINNWKNFTRQRFQSRLLTGDHFFIHKHPATMVDLITGVLV